MVTLTINGVEVTVERGTTILEAAQKAGARIPTLCHDKRLIPYGSCRMCMVEVTARGKTRLMPACFNPARDGMEVATHTPRLADSRRMQLLLILRSHPLQCPTCDAAGDCELQNLVHEYEVPELPFSRDNRYYHADNDSHFIRHNMNLCIKCGMCVRICDEVQGMNEISFIHRGMTSEVSTDFQRPLDCEFCGQCAAICPVGAIRSRWLVGTGRDFELKRSDTTCSFCSLGCTLTLGKKHDKVVYVTSPASSPNEGSLCVKGRYGWPYVYAAERLTKPLIRKDGALREVEWNEALSFVAEGFNKIKNESGTAGLAALGSARLTNEEAYVFGRFVRTVLETPNLDHAGGYAYRPLVDVIQPALGFPAGTNSIREIRKSQVILLLGADLTETHPVAKNEAIIATGRHRARVIVVDAVRHKLTDRKGLYLAARPGTEHLIANAMLKSIIDGGLFDKAALDLRVEGFDEMAASLADYAPEKVGAITGVDPELIKEAAKEFAEAPTASVVMTLGMNRPVGSIELAKAAVNLALVTGKVGKPGCGIHLLGEKANSQGAVDMGLGPDLLPGFKSIADEAARTKLEKAWGSALPKEKGLDAREILAGAETGAIRGLYVVGENPVDTYPDRGQVESALKKLEFLVVQDLFLSSTAQMADVVLPVASFAEKNGTYTSAERLVSRVKPIIKAGNKSDLEIFTALAAVMGKPSLTYSGPEQVMGEIADVADAYRGVSYDRLVKEVLPWPCVDSEDAGKSLLYEGGFPSGKAKLLPAAALAEPDNDGLPMYMIPGVVKFHSGSFSQWSFSMMEVCGEAYAEMDSGDAKALGVQAGDLVKISSAAGNAIRVKVKPSWRALPGTVIVPQHFSGVKLNGLTRWDRSVVKVQVEKV